MARITTIDCERVMPNRFERVLLAAACALARGETPRQAPLLLAWRSPSPRLRPGSRDPHHASRPLKMLEALRENPCLTARAQASG